MCLFSLDLKRKGIGNKVRVHTVRLGCDSRNKAGNKSVVIVTGVSAAHARERRASLETFQDLHKPFLRAVMRDWKVIRMTGLISI